MLKKVRVLLVALIFVTALVSTSLAQSVEHKETSQPQTQSGATTGGQSTTKTGESEKSTGMGGEKVTPMTAQPGADIPVGTVKSLDPAKGTITLILDKDFGGKKKGEEVTISVADTVKFPGSQWKSISEIKPGDKVAFKAEEVGGKQTIQSLEPAPSGAAGQEQGRVGEQGQIRPTEPTKPGETGTGQGSPTQTQPGQQGQSGQPQTQSSQSGHESGQQQGSQSGQEKKQY